MRRPTCAQVRATCELGFFIYHLHEDCRAPDHRKALSLPYVMPIDHYLDPVELSTSEYAHRPLR